MNRKIIYFINPISGTKDKQSVIQLIKDKTTAANIPFEILETNARGDYAYLKEKILQENITDVVVCGGDGTINKIASFLTDKKVNVGIIPMGSGNGLALTANIPKNANKALDIIFRGKSSEVDAFFINDNFSCMLCGLGFDAQVAHDFANSAKRGLTTYIIQTIRNFISAKPYKFQIEVNGLTTAVEAFFISIANSNQFGNQFTIAPQASLNDGLLDIVIVKKMSKLNLVLAVLKHIRLGRASLTTEIVYDKKNIIYFQTPSLNIFNSEQAPLHIDGDPTSTKNTFKIEIFKNAIKLIQPLP